MDICHGNNMTSDDDTFLYKIKRKIFNNKLVTFVIILFIIVTSAGLFTREFLYVINLLSCKKENIQKTFRILNYDDQILFQELEKRTGYKYDYSENATYSIRFDYSGDIYSSIHNGKYLYNGGKIVIIINNSGECEIEEFNLKQYPDEPGNPKHLLEEELKKEISYLVKSNHEIVIRSLLECLGVKN